MASVFTAHPEEHRHHHHVHDHGTLQIQKTSPPAEVSVPISAPFTLSAPIYPYHDEKTPPGCLCSTGRYNQLQTIRKQPGEHQLTQGCIELDREHESEPVDEDGKLKNDGEHKHKHKPGKCEHEVSDGELEDDGEHQRGGGGECKPADEDGEHEHEARIGACCE
ncbi:hypothetical protein C8T65DRAFT_745347 [Cerioporus squamosus]|nr:hypothetical protein C8T65DRAFT_745347 [Cerioporus squamosus]